ncbi:hypothetical protein B0H10DRAFT_1948946 [Mycena sp. CBHHK59/15]|nr:hypothetical protein B0H10DRAFT_1948946 [Mycena sp. CBHHK59/15]
MSLAARHVVRAESDFPLFVNGCTVESGHNDTLAPCCAAVGSTPALMDGTYGCRYNAVFVPAANQSFGSCALEHGAGSSCAPASQSNSAVQPRIRWSTMALLMVIAAALSAVVQ